MQNSKIIFLRILVLGIAMLVLGTGSALSQVSVTLPTISSPAGTIGTIPVTVSNLTGQAVYSFQFDVFYNSAVINIIGATATDMTTGGFLEVNATSGRIRVAWARGSVILGSGVLINLSVSFVNVGTSTLTFVDPGTTLNTFVFNAGTPTATTTPGSATVPGISVNFVDVPNVGRNDTILIPIRTTALTAVVYSLDFTARFDQTKLRILPDPSGLVLTGALGDGGFANINPNNTLGTVSVAWARGTAMATGATGIILWLRAIVIGLGEATLSFTTFQFNAGTPTVGAFSGKVTSVNRRPVITAVTARTVAEGALLSFSVTGTDPDGDALTYSFTSSPAATGATMTAAGAFTWTPGFDQAGTYSVTYRVTDALGLSDSSVSTITVTNVNRRPVFTAVPAQSARAGDAFSLIVLATDPDTGDVITYSATIPATAAGAVFTAATRTLAWTPTAAQVGAHTFRFRATDTGGLFDSIAVVVTVTKTNRPPVFVIQMPDTSARTHVAFSFTYTARDPDLDPVRYSLLSPPTGSRIDAVTGVFTWTPLKTQIGTHDIVVVISDGVLSETSTISRLTVTLFNNPPTWVAGSLPPDTTIKEIQTYTFRYRAADIDPGDVLKYVYVVRPTGAVIDSVTGVITWTPTFDQGRTAPYTNIVSVTDGIATIRDTSFITVTNVNRPPVFTQRMPDTMIVVAKLFSFKYIASDPDLDPIFYFIVSGPTGATINQLGTFFWTPATTQLGIFTVVVGVRDYADTVRTTNKISSVNVGVEDKGTIPTEYKLFQNYPNPFNPSTVIKYGIPKEAMVSLKIFNSIGEEITRLVNGIQQAGYYKYELDASKLNSGIYFYRLQAGDFVSIKKMMYLK